MDVTTVVPVLVLGGLVLGALGRWLGSQQAPVPVPVRANNTKPRRR